ncbi:MAG: GNAT family N-acetyltransferase [Chryseobacterium sp.]|nr:MAG: GNAT family N-acetyltransferase [Chryseobacterium sp.]
MMESIETMRAKPDDHQVLTDITKKSKAYWGYSAEQMEEWSDLLTITEEYIKTNEVYHLSINDVTIAFYSYLILNEDSAKLDNLFVLPSEIRKGYGKLLMNDFLNKIRETTIKNITLDADPNAQKFYERFGFVKIGEIETSVKDRFLPIMEKKL